MDPRKRILHFINVFQISDAGPGMTALPVYVESETDSGSPSSGGLYVSFQDNVDTSFLSDDKHQVR